MIIYVKDNKILGIAENDVLIFDEKHKKYIVSEIPENLEFYDFDEIQKKFILNEKRKKEILKKQKIENIYKEYDKKVMDLLKEYDYNNEGELALYYNDKNSIWHKEAKELKEKIENIYKEMYQKIEDLKNA